MPVRRPSPLLGEHNALLAEVTSESDNAEPPDRQAARVI
jgi:hypothetical protein